MSPLHSRYVNKIYKMQYKENVGFQIGFFSSNYNTCLVKKYWNAWLVFQRKKREFKTEEKCDHVLFNIPCQMSKRISENTRRDSFQNEIRKKLLLFLKNAYNSSI